MRMPVPPMVASQLTATPVLPTADQTSFASRRELVESISKQREDVVLNAPRAPTMLPVASRKWSYGERHVRSSTDASWQKKSICHGGCDVVRRGIPRITHLSATHRPTHRGALLTQQAYVKDLPAKSPGGKGMVANFMSCDFCGTTESPEWRRGPRGQKSLCNACGLHFAKLQKQRKVCVFFVVF